MAAQTPPPTPLIFHMVSKRVVKLDPTKHVRRLGDHQKSYDLTERVDSSPFYPQTGTSMGTTTTTTTTPQGWIIPPLQLSRRFPYMPAIQEAHDEPRSDSNSNEPSTAGATPVTTAREEGDEEDHSQFYRDIDLPDLGTSRSTEETLLPTAHSQLDQSWDTEHSPRVTDSFSPRLSTNRISEEAIGALTSTNAKEAVVEDHRELTKLVESHTGSSRKQRRHVVRDSSEPGDAEGASPGGGAGGEDEDALSICLSDLSFQ